MQVIVKLGVKLIYSDLFILFFKFFFSDQIFFEDQVLYYMLRIKVWITNCLPRELNAYGQ